MRFVLILIAIALMGHAVYRLWRIRDFFHPLCSQALIVAAIIGFRILYVLQGTEGYFPDQFTSAPEALLLEAVLFYLAFFTVSAIVYWTIGARLIGKGRVGYDFRSFPSLEPWPLTVSWSYLFVGLGSLAFLSGSLGVGKFLSDPVAGRQVYGGNWTLMYGMILPLAGALLCYGRLLEGKRSAGTHFLFWCCLVVALAGLLLSGSRGYLIYSMMSFLALRAAFRRVIDYRLLAAFVLFAVVLIPVMDGLVYGRLWSEVSHGDIGAVATHYQENAEGLSSYAYGRYYTLEGTARTLLFLDSGLVPHGDWQYLIDLPRIILPTALVGFKPSVTQDIANVFFFDKYGPELGTSAVTSLPAFMFWQAGWIGFLLAALLYGLFMRFWVAVYEDRSMASHVYIAFTYPYYLMVFVGHSGTIAEFIYLQIMLLPLMRFGVGQRIETPVPHEAQKARGALPLQKRGTKVWPVS